MYPLTIPEEELKNKVAQDFFSDFDSTQILGEIDFCVSFKRQTFFEDTYFLWAEAKKGNEADIYESFTQLILTIAKHKHHQKYQPPPFLGAFDAQKFALIKYSEVMGFFDITDFDYQHIIPSKHESKDFQRFHSQIKSILENKRLLFYFDRDNAELKSFIKANFILENAELNQIQITEDNFVHIYIKWLNAVKPSIAIDYEAVKPDILDTDFYLADLLSHNNSTKEIIDNLRILLEGDSYRVRLEKVKLNTQVIDTFTNFSFNDGQKAHAQFWNKYKRPPKEKFWDKFIARRDLLVPADIRERKGAFFTPQIWVQKAQEYLQKVFGKNYQDEYYIWDCAAGTGNLLSGLNNKYHIFASDFDKSNVDIMKELAKTNESEIKLNLLENHIFEFDFLNDDFNKLPKELQDIINDDKRREKLIIFINPPYGEVGNPKTAKGTGKSKDKIAKETKIYQKYSPIISTACSELFAQFFIRIYKEIPNCILASFSTPKYINYQNFIKFRQEFKAKFLKGFIVPAHTFDNVGGEFPIGFLIWDLSKHDKAKKVSLEICDTKIKGIKTYFACEKKEDYITAWLQQYYDKEGKELGILMADAPDFQNNNHTAFLSKIGKAHLIYKIITLKNLIPFCIYFTLRQIIPINWLNNKDNFLFPNDKWEQDFEFQSDCLYFAIFDEGQNKINARENTNHFIPFAENEVEARGIFKSHFMNEFLRGKIQKENKSKNTLFDNDFVLTKSKEAKIVCEAGLALWKYYHKNATNDKYNVNASLYNIKEYFQGRQETKNGKIGDLNKTSKDEKYNELMTNLRKALKALAEKIALKIYDYGFLRE